MPGWRNGGPEGGTDFHSLFSYITADLWGKAPKRCTQGSLVQRELSAKLTEGLTTPPSKIKDFAHLPLHKGGFGTVIN